MIFIKALKHFKNVAENKMQQLNILILIITFVILIVCQKSFSKVTTKDLKLNGKEDNKEANSLTKKSTDYEYDYIDYVDTNTVTPKDSNKTSNPTSKNVNGNEYDYTNTV